MLIKSLSRRRFVASAGIGLVAAPAIVRGIGSTASANPSSLFTLGVMSGDPGARHVTLWTRLAPDPLNGGGLGQRSIPVRWEVATDPDMRNVVRRGRTVASAGNGHAVKVLAAGLPSDRWFFYRFEAMGDSSRVGRTRTFPSRFGDDDAGFGRRFRREPGESEFEFEGFGEDEFEDGVRPASRMRFALTSCQNYQQGFYAAWRDIAEQDIDFIVHAGDYIYESGPTSTPFDPARVHTGGEIFSVEDYRNRYALYRLDQNLQDAQARCPVIHTPDDHEVDNDYAGLNAEEGAPFVGEEFAQRRRNAYKALFESMPYGPGVRLGRNGDRIRLFRQIDFGNLASLYVLDTRQFRDNQPAEAGFGSADPDIALLEPVFGEKLFDPAIDDPDSQLLGARQEQWLENRLSRSRAQWNVLAQQIMVTPWNLLRTAALTIELNPSIPDANKQQIATLISQVDDFLNADAWDGYRGARKRLLNFLDRQRPSNPIVLTGDIHSSWGANLLQDFSDSSSDMLAAEFVCTSISSTFLGADPRPTDFIVRQGLPGLNPHIEFFNGLFRGYCLCDVDRQRWQTTYRSVGTLADLQNTADPLAMVPKADSPVVTDAVLEIQDGFNRPGSGQRISTMFSQLPSA